MEEFLNSRIKKRYRKMFYIYLFLSIICMACGIFFTEPNSDMDMLRMMCLAIGCIFILFSFIFLKRSCKKGYMALFRKYLKKHQDETIEDLEADFWEGKQYSYLGQKIWVCRNHIFYVPLFGIRIFNNKELVWVHHHHGVVYGRNSRREADFICISDIYHERISIEYDLEQINEILKDIRRTQPHIVTEENDKWKEMYRNHLDDFLEIKYNKNITGKFSQTSTFREDNQHKDSSKTSRADQMADGNLEITVEELTYETLPDQRRIYKALNKASSGQIRMAKRILWKAWIATAVVCISCIIMEYYEKRLYRSGMGEHNEKMMFLFMRIMLFSFLIAMIMFIQAGVFYYATVLERRLLRITKHGKLGYAKVYCKRDNTVSVHSLSGGSRQRMRPEQRIELTTLDGIPIKITTVNLTHIFPSGRENCTGKNVYILRGKKDFYFIMSNINGAFWEQYVNEIINDFARLYYY